MMLIRVWVHRVPRVHLIVHTSAMSISGSRIAPLHILRGIANNQIFYSRCIHPPTQQQHIRHHGWTGNVVLRVLSHIYRCGWMVIDSQERSSRTVTRISVCRYGTSIIASCVLSQQWQPLLVLWWPVFIDRQGINHHFPKFNTLRFRKWKWSSCGDYCVKVKVTTF